MCFLLISFRELGEPSKSEITVNKIEAYYTMNSFLSELKGTEIKTVEDVLTFNEVNTGTEGATPGVHPAYHSGQVSPATSLAFPLTKKDRISCKMWLGQKASKMISTTAH